MLDHEAAAVVGLVIAPEARRRGVAHALLTAALDDLAARGIRTVDAYPLRADPPDAAARDPYRGPRTLFESAGFVEIAATDRIAVMRKTLQPGS